MKNILLLLSIIFIFNFCKGQKEDKKIYLKQKTEAKIYSAKCKGEYSTGEKISEKEKKWTLSRRQIDEIIQLSSEITDSEWHFSYSVTPCNIEIKDYLYKGKKYDLSINGGSYISLFDGKKNILLGCDSPDCKKYFLQPKESMEDQSSTSENLNSTESKSYTVDFNKDAIPDLLIIRKNGMQIIVEAEIKKVLFFTKAFDCDFIDIETNTKYNQSFNLILNYTDQYEKPFRKVVIPIFYKNNNFFIDKLFMANLETSAKTGNEEWIYKKINKKSLLQQLNIDLVISE